MALLTATAPTSRLFLPDFLRAMAICLMLVFHTCFDLRYFQWWDLKTAAPLIWRYLPNLIVSLFFMAVGFSLVLAHSPQVAWKKFFQRLLRIALGAGLISGVTYWYLPDNWIYFGTLHCIVLVSILGLPLRNLPQVSLMLAFIILTTDLGLHVSWPWWNLPHQSADYIPPLPWFSAVLSGIWLAHRPWSNWCPRALPHWVASTIKFLGRHALLIYLLHQPLIFGIFALVDKLSGRTTG